MLEKDLLRKSQEGELQFKPLTEGLGFQPFSDGLPYAPLSKNSKSSFLSTSGAGASVAGPQRIHSSVTKNQKHDQGSSVLPSTHSQIKASGALRSPQPSAPLLGAHERESLIPSSRPLAAGVGISGSAPPLQVSAQVPTPSVSLGRETSLLEEEESAVASTLSKRVFAYLIDLGFNSLLMSTILGVTFWFYEIEFQFVQHTSLLGLALAFLAASSWVLVLLQEVVFKTSLGKYFFRLVLSGGRGQILIRGIFFLGSCALGGLGLVWAFFDPNRACLHDRLLGSQPEEMKNYN